MTEPMRENERIAKRIIDTSADGDNSPRYNWAEAELIKALDSKDLLIQAKESELASLRTLVKDLGWALKSLLDVQIESCACGFVGCQDKFERLEQANKALLLIPEDLRKDKI